MKSYWTTVRGWCREWLLLAGAVVGLLTGWRALHARCTRAEPEPWDELPGEDREFLKWFFK